MTQWEKTALAAVPDCCRVRAGRRTALTVRVCISGLDEHEVAALGSWHVLARANSRQELLNAVSTLEPDVLVIDLDRADALNHVIAASELRPELGVVGITGAGDLNFALAAQRAGVDQIVARPIDAGDFAKAMQRVAPRAGEGAPELTISVMAATGGSGGTTLACHLAVELAAVSHDRVELVDLDLDFGCVARMFDLAPERTIADLCHTPQVDPDLVRRASVALPLGVDVLARPNTIQEVRELDEGALQCVIQAAAVSHRYTVFDLPHKLDAVVGFAIEQSDKFVIVSQLTVPSVDGTRRLVEALLHGGVPQEAIEIVVNRYRRNAYACPPDVYERQLKIKPIAFVPNDYLALREAIDVGRPLEEKNAVRAAIAQLAARLAGQQIELRPRRGWLSMLGLGRGAAARVARA